MKFIFSLLLLLSVPSFSYSIFIGTPLTPSAKKVLLLGSGELGKELTIELQRLGVEVIACDKYENAPAMHVAHKHEVFTMSDEQKLREIVEKVEPDLIVPEVESLDTNTLIELEKEGYNIIPTARATLITMDRQKIRKLAAEELEIKTSNYAFAHSKEEIVDAIEKVGVPCVIKPVMSSSGKGQTIIEQKKDALKAWEYAQSGARGVGNTVIIEEFVPFDSEITLLTVAHKDGISFCAPIGHRQEKGDYRESWQPHIMKEELLKEAQDMAEKVVKALGGYGIFGVEFFIKGDEIYFSELSPRPHDTGMVTLISQELSEFALHARAILELPLPEIKLYSPSASSALLVRGDSQNVRFGNLGQALSQPGTNVRLFGKPEVHGERRMGVTLATGTTTDEARKKAEKIKNKITIEL